MGFFIYYFIFLYREGGDIDIFIYLVDYFWKSDVEVNWLVDWLMEEKGIEVDFEYFEKYSMFYYKGILIENYKIFINLEIYCIVVKMDKFF